MQGTRSGLKIRPVGASWLLVLTWAAASSAAADCWIDTPAAYRKIGGASRIGPYASRGEADAVNRSQFHGTGTVWCDRTPPPPARGYRSVILHNATRRPVAYWLRNSPRSGWNQRTLASGGGYYDYQPEPAAFVVAFDASDAAGYQEKRYDLEGNLTTGAPGATDARPYSFVEVAGGVDVVTGRRAPPEAPRPPPASDPTAAWVARRVEAGALVREAQADLAELEVVEVDAARIQGQVFALEQDVDLQQGLLRRLSKEREGVDAVVAAWDGAAARLAEPVGRCRERGAALRGRFEGRLRELREAGVVPVIAPREPPPEVAIGLPIGPLPKIPPPVSEARIASEKDRADRGLPPVVAVVVRTPVPPLGPSPVTSDMLRAHRATRDRVHAELAQARAARDRVAATSLEVRLRLQDLARRSEAAEAGVLERKTTAQRLQAHVADELLEAYVAEAEAAFAEAALRRLEAVLPRDVVALGHAIGEAVEGELERFEAWFSAVQSNRLYARTMLAETEPGGLVERIGTAIRASMIVHAFPEEAERARRALERRWRTFAVEVQDLGVPDEASRWVDVLRIWLDGDEPFDSPAARSGT